MTSHSEKPEFWETVFAEKQEMWGFEPCRCAVLTRDLFVQHSLKNILVPGIGYGRNARVFTDQGMAVTGIEISKTALELARKHFGSAMTLYHGSVLDMPFDDAQYDGIFCYALIHLLDSDERVKLIRDCYRQLSPGGLMLFGAISKASPTYGTGTFISTDRYEIFERVKIFFYDEASVHEEFDRAGLIQITEVQEHFPFYLIICQKGEAEL